MSPLPYDPDGDDEFDEIIPPELMPKLAPRDVARIDQIRARAKDIANTAVEEGRDPEEATVEVMEELLKLRDIRPRE